MNGIERGPQKSPDNGDEIESERSDDKVDRRTFLKKAAIGVVGIAAGLSESSEGEASEQLEMKKECFQTLKSLGNRVNGLSGTYEYNAQKFGEIKRAGVSKYFSECRAEFYEKASVIAGVRNHSLNVKMQRANQQVKQEQNFEHFVLTGKELEGKPDPQLNDYAVGKIPIRPEVMEERIQEAALRRAAAPERVLGKYEIAAWQAAERGDKDISRFKENIFDVIKHESSAIRLDQRVEQITKEMKNYGFKVNEAKARRIIYGELQRRRVEWSFYFSDMEKN